MLLARSSLVRRAPLAMRTLVARGLGGLSTIMQRNPDDVVITFAKRTPMGRAKKGQLKDVPVDELLLALFTVTVNWTL